MKILNKVNSVDRLEIITITYIHCTYGLEMFKSNGGVEINVCMVLMVLKCN